MAARSRAPVPAPAIRPGEKVVVALGGNALVRSGEEPTIATQFRNVERAMTALVPLVRNGNRLVITHGNGFQVGNILIRVEESLGKAYAVPLEVCVAESQGELGYLIEQSLHNVLARRRLRAPIASVLTQVVVDRRDPAFRRPTKPVGPALSPAAARRLARQGMSVVEQPGVGWRKVVASPRPIEIEDVDVVGWLLRRGAIVVAAGGGGVPVTRQRDGSLRGVPAVIDKDLASALLARAIRARHLIILTGEPCVYRDYGRRSQRPLRWLGIDEAERELAGGQFPEGSMGPKIEAALDFLRGGGRDVLITAAEQLGRALSGRAGTLLTTRGRAAVTGAA